MTIGIHAGDRLWFFGNSITDGGPNEGGIPWPSATGGLIDQIQALVTAGRNTTKVTTSGAIAKSSGAHAKASAAPSPPVTVVTFGVGGDTLVQIAAYLPAQLALIPPGITSPVFIIEGGTNDASAASCTTGATSIISQIQATWPAARIIFMSCMIANENWVNVPPPAWPASQFDLNNPAILAASQTATNGAYVDTRTPALAWEVVNNPGKAASGFATVDGIHPKIVCMVSIMAPAFLATISVGP